MPCSMRSRRPASGSSTCPHHHTACGRRFKRPGPEERTMYAVDYQQVKTLGDAAKLLAKTGGRPLAGGQSLVAAMKLRLAQPGTLVDLGGIAELQGIRRDGEALVIGAMTRHAE